MLISHSRNSHPLFLWEAPGKCTTCRCIREALLVAFLTRTRGSGWSWIRQQGSKDMASHWIMPLPILASYMGAPRDVKTILVCHECSAYICKVHAAPTRRRRSGPCSSGQSQLCSQSAKDCTKNTPADIIVDTVTDTKLITSELTEIITCSATDLLKLI